MKLTKLIITKTEEGVDIEYSTKEDKGGSWKVIPKDTVTLDDFKTIDRLFHQVKVDTRRQTRELKKSKKGGN